MSRETESASAPPITSPTRATPADVPPTFTGSPPPDMPPSTGRPSISLSQPAYAAGNTCVQCGLCLPACPTYLETGNEADSPRGRIRLMLGLNDGDVDLTPAGQEHLDRCLDCRACETACPSGVEYHLLIEDARHKLANLTPQESNRQGGLGRLGRWMVFHVLTRPERLRLALLPARLLQKVGLYGLLRRVGLMRLVPGVLGRMERMLSDSGPLWPKPIPSHCRAGGMDLVVSMLSTSSGRGSAKATVGFFEGCVASVMGSDVHHKAAELLCAAGADVISPPEQICCGAIHHHGGEVEQARAMARRNIDIFLPADGTDLDYIITCTAGDGAMLRQYAEILADDPFYAERARRFSSKVRDVSEVLLDLGLPEFKQRLVGQVTYHDACHLAHGQRVTSAPRALLEKIPGLTLVPLPESDICCGAAGTYNLGQPKMAEELAHRKLENVAQTRCRIVASGNIGCNLHLQAQARTERANVRFIHPVELLHEAVFGCD